MLNMLLYMKRIIVFHANPKHLFFAFNNNKHVFFLLMNCPNLTFFAYLASDMMMGMWHFGA